MNRLCKLYGLSKGGVMKLLRDAGVMMRRQGLSEEQIEQAVMLYSEGHSYAEISRRLDKAKSSVRAAILKRGN